MRALILILLVLVAWAGYSLGAAEPRVQFGIEDCFEMPRYGEEYRQAVKRAAIENASALHRDRNQIYGFTNRFSQKWYGARANTTSVLNWLLGTKMPLPEFTRANTRQAQSGIDEFALLYNTATVLGVTLCETQFMVPQSRTDSLHDATLKLERLIARLEGSG